MYKRQNTYKIVRGKRTRPRHQVKAARLNKKKITLTLERQFLPIYVSLRYGMLVSMSKDEIKIKERAILGSPKFPVKRVLNITYELIITAKAVVGNPE